MTDSLTSLDRPEARGPFKLALPGHGRPLTDVAAVIADHRAQYQTRLALTLDAFPSPTATTRPRLV